MADFFITDTFQFNHKGAKKQRKTISITIKLLPDIAIPS